MKEVIRLINQEYEDLLRNNNRGSYLKGSKRKAKDTKENNRELPDGPVMRDEGEIRKH